MSSATRNRDRGSNNVTICLCCPPDGGDRGPSVSLPIVRPIDTMFKSSVCVVQFLVSIATRS